jgi:hypothetical protein
VSMWRSGIVPVPDYPAVDSAAQAAFTFGQLPLVVLAVALTARLARRRRSPAPIILLVGGSLCMFIEPVVDHTALVWFPTEGQWTAFSAFGVDLPIWLALAYVWFFGGQAVYVWKLLDEGLPGSRLLPLAAAFYVVDAALEHPGLYLHLFDYYGKQPLEITKFPLWAGFVNATIPIVAATLVYVGSPLVSGWRGLGLVVLPVAASASVNAGANLPVLLALNSDLPGWIGQLLAFVTLAACVVLIKASGAAVALIRQLHGRPGAALP